MTGIHNLTQLHYFGTDGIRGRVGQAPMRPDFLLQLGWAIGQVLTGDGRQRVLIGKDTRISGYLLESSLEAGLSAAGVDAYLVGPMPTPAIAYLTKSMLFDAGIMLSASHNPFEDNGVKLFNRDGFKLDDTLEAELERIIQLPMQMVEPARLGKAYRIEDALARYLKFCRHTLPSDLSMHGLRLVVDCANGSNYYLAPKLLTEFGANIKAIGNKPDGININAGCGSTHPQLLQQQVSIEKADVGIAFDGDGDRLIMVDNLGNIVDGDQLLYILAKYAKQQGTLQGGVVGTLMSNLGLELALKKDGIPFKRSKVGDRYVLEQLQHENWQLGGESSGHILNLAWSTAGDALIAVIQILAIMVKTGHTLAELAGTLQKYPQHMINVKRVCALNNNINKALEDLVTQYEKQLGDKGRILLRPSGTEPLIRVMVEGEDQQKIIVIAEALANDVSLLLEKSNT